MDPRFDIDAQSTGTLPGLDPTALPRSERPEPPRGWRRPAPASALPAATSRSSRTGACPSSPVSREWTRIGRSLAADIRFDDATVSRRHALIASEEGGVRVLDDRSLNGIQVNGRRVEWSPLMRRRRDPRRPPHAVLPGHDERAQPGPPGEAGHPLADPIIRPNARYRAGRMADTIAVLSLKGGTGKTTTVRTLADVLRRVGLNVLTIDLDPQGNLSDYFDVPAGRLAGRRRRARRATPRSRTPPTTGSSPRRSTSPRSSAR